MGEETINYSKEQYNEEPVFYCKECLSLKIRTIVEGSDLDFCDNCGATNIAKTSIEEWEKMYRERYGFDHLTNKLVDNGRERKTNL